MYMCSARITLINGRIPHSSAQERPAYVFGISNGNVVFTTDFWCGILPEQNCTINILVESIDKFKSMYNADDIETDFADDLQG